MRRQHPLASLRHLDGEDGLLVSAQPRRVRLRFRRLKTRLIPRQMLMRRLERRGIAALIGHLTRFSHRHVLQGYMAHLFGIVSTHGLAEGIGRELRRVFSIHKGSNRDVFTLGCVIVRRLGNLPRQTEITESDFAFVIKEDARWMQPAVEYAQ